MVRGRAAVRKGGGGVPRTAAVAVVGRAEDGDDVLLVAPVVPLHHQLVRPRHQVQPVGVVELRARPAPPPPSDGADCCGA